MDWIFDNDRPIYVQLVEQLKIAIVSGIYTSGQKLPSVRDLAVEIKANPNTVQRALVELENMGIIYTERTNGKFVTKEKALLEKIKQEIAKESYENFIQNMKKLGYTQKEIEEYVIKNKGE